ncbi:MAG: hypothetical protein KBD36_03595 [Alphaproteobacteria bacterium]|jgi:hypothetical protein|nr:hypothetical protein [Alphaproteobacteria bacterium]MBP9776908.1 hypothetical protein [Alphaproteobacteria bacterium]
MKIKLFIILLSTLILSCNSWAMEEDNEASNKTRRMLIAYKGCNNQKIKYVSTHDGDSWTSEEEIPNVGLSHSLSLCEISYPAGSQLFCAYQGRHHDPKLRYTTNYVNTDPLQKGWEAEEAVPNVGLSHSPSLAVFSNILYCAYQGSRFDHRLRYVTRDLRNSTIDLNSNGWSEELVVPGVRIFYSPSLAAFNNALYCAYHGSDEDKHVRYVSTIDGINWCEELVGPGVGLSLSPSLAVFNNTLYCAYQGKNCDQKLRYISTHDGINWSEESVVPGARIYSSPSLAVFNNALYCAYQGSTHDHKLAYVSTYDGINWSGEAVVPGVGFSDSPCLLTFNSSF